MEEEEKKRIMFISKALKNDKRFRMRNVIVGQYDLLPDNPEDDYRPKEKKHG